MKVRNLKARVLAIHIPTGEGAVKGQPAPVTTLFLAPGFNDIAKEHEESVRAGLTEYVEEGFAELVGEDEDPFKGSVEKVVAAVKDTYDRDLLEEVRKTAKSRKVRDAVDDQMKKITDHRAKTE